MELRGFAPRSSRRSLRPWEPMPRAGWSCGGSRLLALPAGQSGLGSLCRGRDGAAGAFASSLFPQIVPALKSVPRAGWSCGGVRLLALPAGQSGLGSLCRGRDGAAGLRPSLFPQIAPALGAYAEGGIRTRKGLLPGDFKSPVSSCSTTPALHPNQPSFSRWIKTEEHYYSRGLSPQGLDWAMADLNGHPSFPE